MPDLKLNSYLLPPQNDLRSLKAYRQAGGYIALEQALQQSPDWVMQTVIDARLRGLGGAGRLAGEKWKIVQSARDEQKYVICNAYDADSRSLAVRSLLDRNPHQVIEGILLAAYSVGASEAYLFSRSLYEQELVTLQEALREAQDANLLGSDILGTDFQCNINVLAVDIGLMGGEETVQMAMIKGRRGMPEQRPPYPAQFGLWDKPTAINSAETLANVPLVIREGADAFRSRGSQTTGGSKLVTIYQGDLHLPQVQEVAFGTPLRLILAQAGVPTDVEAVVVGGHEGGALPASALDISFDFDALEEAGAIVGSGVLEILPTETCMVSWAMERMRFLSKESCGKCVPCRLGVKRITGVLEGIVSDIGVESDLKLLDELAGYVTNGSLCGFGVQASNPLKTVRRYWPQLFTQYLEGQRPKNAALPVRSHRFITKHVLP